MTADPDEGRHEHADGDRPSIFRDDRAAVRRRSLAKGVVTAGGVASALSLAAPLSALRDVDVLDPSYDGPVYEEEIYLVDADGERIAEDRLDHGEVLTVFPEPRPDIADAPTLLVRHSEDAYADETALEHTVSGYAAFSKVCTHMGCMVSEVNGARLVCPCHIGEFDPRDGAAVVGGPPPRPLPQLPITLSSDGYLIATGDFLGTVGVK
ncbi:Rieske (2Fe-2S) protein [Salinilacihabitans rarus]|uniref:Rieske (2Fe-2S) protein n=1 Tax=Salinilacihabitans rarus TaxID=2961596 RepID=UPI0020C84E9A|nr:Rieske (2Fe-2S) protein [Salinilacihabitans rarus]